jgi:4-hydroxy-tetrahydrodipicolinate reductase
MIPVVIWGAGGRMGKRLIRLVQQSNDLTVAGAIEAGGHPGVYQDSGLYHDLPETGVQLSLDFEPVVVERGVVLDFSLSGGLEKASQWALKYRWPLVSGTTALTDVDRIALDSATEEIPVMYAPNYSIGIQVMNALLDKAARALPEYFSAMISETHHAAKQDRPSGTARVFHDRLKEYGPGRSVDIASLRGGTIIGEHSIRFVSDLEELTISHRAFNRDVFAAGALDASRWIVKQKPGLYSFSDMLESV